MQLFLLFQVELRKKHDENYLVATLNPCGEEYNQISDYFKSTMKNAKIDSLCSFFKY